MDINLEDLIEALSEAKSNRGIQKHKSSVTRFIKQWGIKEGKDRVPTYVIFYTYRIKWQGDKRPNKVKRVPFFREFTKHFKQVRTGKQRYYLLDSSQFDLSREGKLEAEHYDEREKKRTKTEKQKKKNKVPKLKKRA